MSVCPFCKAPVQQTTAPCPRCGKLASEHPSIAAVQGRTLNTDFDDEPLGDLDLQQGSGVGGAGGSAAASYDGGGVTFDDDLFGDGDAGALELDVPAAHGAHGSRGAMVAEPPAGPAVPDLVLDAPPVSSAPQLAAGAAMRASGTHPTAGTSGTHPAAVAAPRPPPGSDRSIPAAPASDPSIPAAPTSGHGFAAPSSSAGAVPAAPSSGSLPNVPAPASAPARPDPAALVAKYPPPPRAIWESPVYACKVLWRQFELRRDLESLRRRRSPDVPLYEAALRTHDPKAFAVGLAITCAGIALASFVFFLPVILRFLRAPD